MGQLVSEILNMLNENAITVYSILFILVVFGYYLGQALKIRRAYIGVRKFLNQEGDILVNLQDSKLSELRQSYEQSIKIDTDSGKKTNIPALVYFSENNIYKILRINIKQLDTAAGALVGLGLLGTFLGLTLGIMGFDSSDSLKIQDSINSLLNGMGTAFFTSLFGMSFSMIYTLCDKRWRNRLSKYIFELTEKLDVIYYIDDIDLAFLKQKKCWKN